MNIMRFFIRGTLLVPEIEGELSIVWDRNTKFSHSETMVQRIQNRIEGLFLYDEE